MKTELLPTQKSNLSKIISFLFTVEYQPNEKTFSDRLEAHLNVFVPIWAFIFIAFAIWQIAET